MNVNKVPLSSWQCVFTVGKWCSRCVWLLRVADGQHRGSGVPVTVGAALRLREAAHGLSLPAGMRGSLWEQQQGLAIVFQ